MKKKSLYQIWIPLIISIILIGWVVFILMRSISGESTLLSQWSDISLIFLLTPIIGSSLVLLLVCIAAIYLFNQAGEKTKTGLQAAQQITQQVKEKTARSGKNMIQLFSGPSVWLKNFHGVHKDE